MDSRPSDASATLVFGLLCAIVVTVLALLGGAQASPASPLDPGTGGLVVAGKDGKTSVFPLKHTSVDVAVSGFMARVTVTQMFTNPYDRRIEATYVFPLPEDAAVDDMTMRIGARTIRGLIKEKQEARKIYEEAKAQGKTASLLEQERPNIFTQSVANILPGDLIEIRISYVQYLKYEKGTLSLVFPMTVGPRYIPGAKTDPDGNVTRVPGMPVSVPDADRITPPVLRPGERSGHDIDLGVALGAGVPFANLRSKSHRIVATRLDDANAIIRLSPADSIPNKDFILEWDVNPDRVATGLLTHRPDTSDNGFFTLMLVPKVDPRPADVTPKEMVFVLDCSGSMSGIPLEQAKQLVRYALGNLNAEDSFQIITFSVAASGLAPLPLPNTPANVRAALRYLDSLDGEGGTEMLTGIKAALAFPPDPERVREVMFLTDGFIGNETQILAAIRANLGSARLSSFGVGSSVNRYLLENMALEGRGTARYVRPDEDAAEPVRRFYEEVRHPFLTDIVIDWAGLDVSGLLPASVPDLFAGHPLFVTGRYGAGGQATVKVHGRIAGEDVVIPVTVRLPETNAQNSVLRALWARRSIEGLMRAMLKGEQPDLVKQVTELSIRHRVLSQYTAFVAVEEKVRTNERGEPVQVEVPVEMPEGTSFEGVFGKEDKDGEKVARIAPAKGGAMTRLLGSGGGAPGPGAARWESDPAGRRWPTR
jgi:Ca-activated chloride channel family protein